MRKTLANLEKEEAAIVVAFKLGTQQGLSMRQHLNNIRKHALYEACDCDSFAQYVKQERLPMSVGQAFRLAANGEVEGYIENSRTCEFSDHALKALSSLRVERDGKRTHVINGKKVGQIARDVIALSIRKTDPVAITATSVKQAIAKRYGEKMPKPLSSQLEAEIKRVGQWSRSFDALDVEMFLDADAECPGVVKRLAKAYSDIASQLRKVQK
jgi:hypothetical protein